MSCDVNVLIGPAGSGKTTRCVNSARSIIGASPKGLPLIFLLSNTLGLLGAQITQPISDFCSFLLAIPFAWKVLKQLKEN